MRCVTGVGIITSRPRERKKPRALTFVPVDRLPARGSRTLPAARLRVATCRDKGERRGKEKTPSSVLNTTWQQQNASQAEHRGADTT